MSHLPRRPSWDCDTCPGEKPWPCDSAREWLTEKFGDHRTRLAAFMQGEMHDAILDRPTLKPDELHERFISWTR